MTNTFGYFWNQLVYGKYSSKFNEYCQRKDIPTPYKLCFAEDPIDHVHEALTLDEKLKIYKTSEPLMFEKLKFFTIEKKITKMFGAPNSFSIMQIDGKDLASYCYKGIYRGQKSKCVYFVYDHQFFMGQYIFSEYSDKLVNEIFSTFTQRFGINNPEKGENFYIEDNYKSRFMFQDTGFSINCKFVSLQNESLLKPLIEYYNPPLPEEERPKTYSKIISE